jgi:hypothetical protein
MAPSSGIPPNYKGRGTHVFILCGNSSAWYQEVRNGQEVSALGVALPPVRWHHLVANSRSFYKNETSPPMVITSNYSNFYLILSNLSWYTSKGRLAVQIS